MSLLWAKVSSSEGTVITPNTPIDIRFKVRVNRDIPSLVVGFNIFSSYQHPLARADFNDLDGRVTLEKGELKQWQEVTGIRVT